MSPQSKLEPRTFYSTFVLNESHSTKIHEVWLTNAGREYLASEYIPTGGGNIILSKKMLTNYLEFLRRYFSTAQQTEQVTPPAAAELPANKDVDDNVIYQAIIDLDKQLRSCTKSVTDLWY